MADFLKNFFTKMKHDLVSPLGPHSVLFTLQAQIVAI